LESEIFREALAVSLHRSDERACLDAVQLGQVSVDHDPSPANDENPALDRLARKHR